jgi:flagellar hook-length control protein FliK
MNISLLKSMFAGNVGTKPTSLKPVANPRTKQPATIPAGDVSPINTGKTVTTDNSQLVAKNKPTIQPSNNFRHTLGKKITTKTSQNAQANKNRKKQNQSSGTLSKMTHPAKSLVIQGILTQPVVLDKSAGAKALNQLQQQVESQIPGKSARLVAGSNLPSSPQTPSLIAQAAKPITSEPVAQAAKPITSEPDQIASATTKPVNKPIQPASVAREKLVNQENAKELVDEISPSDGKTTTVSKKSIVTDKASVFESPKTLETNKTAITSKAITDQKSGQEQSVVTNKPFAPDSPKTQLPNATSTAPLDQSSHSQQKVSIGQESTAPVAEETIPNKADTGQKDHRGKTELLELSEKNRVQIENLSVKSIAQKMNPQRTQLSAPQIENHNNLLSNHGSNPGMEQGEQVLGNNVQPGITEQSPSLAASEAFAKTAGNVNSDASVGSQIQESIHSSLQSGSQQIIIRLNPPELGKVNIKFTEQGDDITGLLQVDKLQTRDQIQQVLPEIIQNLQDSGIGIKRLEVTLTNQQEQHTPKDQSSTAGQDSFSGQQSLPNPESQRNNTIYSELLTNIDNVPEYMQPQMQLTDNSINMLI